MGEEIWIVIRWWGTLFLIGTVAFPLSKQLFSGWYDRGYLFSKAIGIALITYLTYILSVLHIAPFSEASVWLSCGIVFVLGLWVTIASYDTHLKNPKHERVHEKQHRTLDRKFSKKELIRNGMVVLIEELFFLAALIFWSWVKGHEPSIRGLEKFMDYGFMQSILNTHWFPAPDMWYANLSINYYYFGHTVVALLTLLSGIDLAYTFNLMLASLFACTLTMSFSIGYQICSLTQIQRIGKIAGGVITAYLVTLAGNMQTMYAFTKGYTGEDVRPFWTLLWNVHEFREKLPEGLQRYWYANATRFIPFTIHEFPSYSFVVSDVHGHVMSLPFTLLAIALLIQIFGKKRDRTHAVHTPSLLHLLIPYGWNAAVLYVFYGILVSVLLMTNALDGPIYLGLFIILFFMQDSVSTFSSLTWWREKCIGVMPTLLVSVVASVPFMYFFKSFVTGIALNCPPAILSNRKIGPFLFEGIEKCQHSPLWMMWLLWGFFIYCGAALIASLVRTYRRNGSREIRPSDTVLAVLFIFSVFLIIFPEFFYFKDIYPAHFRSNTMFKLGYQAYIMFSIVSGYVIIRVLNALLTVRHGAGIFWKKLFLVFLIPQLFLISIYPLFSVRSYFDSLRTYKTLDGLSWLRDVYPDDFAAIQWLKRTYASKSDPSAIRPARNDVPVLVEADGDSYTDYARYSVFTGFPSVMGWPVHEWLWRGSYDVVAPRREEVRVIYESENEDETNAILRKYSVEYIVVSGFEREKFTSLNLEKLMRMGTVVYTYGDTRIIKVRN